MINKILYTGSFRYPDIDAAAFRVNGVCKLFSEHGCDIEIAGWESNNKTYIFDGYQCHPQNEFNDGRENNAVRRLIGFIFRGTKTFKWIRQNNRFDLYILYNPPAYFSLLMLLWARLSGRKIALDITEWYESSHLIGGKYGLVSIENWIRMKIVYPMFDNIIVISKFLEDYFKSRGSVNVMRCYPLSHNACDRESFFSKEVGKSTIDFIYAGQPGKKDLLIDFIKGIPELEIKLGKKVIFHMVGPKKEAFLDMARENGFSFDNVKSNLVFYGLLSREKVFELYKKSDFSVLFRENKRYAKAGFPTKGMESLVNGCPIILNDVGDISLVVKNIHGGIVSQPDNISFIADSIINRQFVRSSISKDAMKYFSRENYTHEICEFIKGVSCVQYRN